FFFFKQKTAYELFRSDLESTYRKAFDSKAPALIEIPTDRDAAGPWVPGWWDFPVPAYIEDERQDEYWATRAKEQHL
ncbi:acetolactate synthase large subunit, partial [Rhodococcus wratislaviensis IFP 2016]